MEKRTGTSSNGVDDSSKAVNIDDENMVSNILSRLPVKSLMRFKCVAKHWCNLIEDPYLVDLHRSKTSLGRLFVVVPWQRYMLSLLLVDVFFDGRGGKGRGKVASTVKHIKSNSTFSCSQILGPVEGSVCLVSNSAHAAACVLNIGTKEVSLWIKSTLFSMEEKTKRSRRSKGVYSFGYDPKSKNYKVICKWVINKDDPSAYQIWEILTVRGHNAWRKIDEVPSYNISRDAPSVYVNGSIYWYPLNSSIMGNSKVSFLLAFDVGKEKFRTIPIPSLDQVDPYVSSGNRCVIRLLEVQNCVTILRKTSSFTVRLSIYEDGKWTRKSIILPVNWDESGALFFHTAAGTNQLFLEIHRKIYTGIQPAISLHSYCFENKIFKQIELKEIPFSASVPEYTRLCTFFRESIISFKESR